MRSQIEDPNNSRSLSEVNDQVHELKGRADINIQKQNLASMKMQTINLSNTKSMVVINTPEDLQSCFSNNQSDQINNIYSKSALL